MPFDYSRNKVKGTNKFKILKIVNSLKMVWTEH